jgi:hypothetical protein
MWILYIIGGIFGIVLIVSFYVMFNIDKGENAEKYGRPSIFLFNFILKLKKDFSEFEIIDDNPGGYKIKFYSNSFDCQFDFIYFKKNIQVCIRINSMLNQKNVKTFYCPYDVNLLEKRVIEKYHEVFNEFLADFQK